MEDPKVFNDCLARAKERAAELGYGYDCALVHSMATQEYLDRTTPPPPQQPTNADLAKKLDEILLIIK